MSVARFFSRISDAIVPLVGSSEELSRFLEQKTVRLEAAPGTQDDVAHRAGFLLATNLLARLYPRLQLVADGELQSEAAELALAINPLCDLVANETPCDLALAWGKHSNGQNAVSVSARGWTAFLNNDDSHGLHATNALTALAAASLAVGEVFRLLFAQFLPPSAATRSSAAWNLIALANEHLDIPSLAVGLDIGSVHLVGAGAVGQAAIHSLLSSGVVGTVTVFDHETVSLSNLQRYVLTRDADVGSEKCALVLRAAHESRLRVNAVPRQWGANRYEAIDTIAAAVDSVATRIALQAALPRRLYNAWTQPADVGWSRHETFGKEPCLACLYIPSGARPSQHQLIARALRQNELRVLAYLTVRAPAGMPLRPEQLPRIRGHQLPPDAKQWIEQPILNDIAKSLGMSEEQAQQWSAVELPDLYREGLCGGAIIRDQAVELPHEVAVPLAHQSALAGIMLATQIVISASDELRGYRPAATEGRLDVLAPLPQIASRPRQRTAGCLCTDPVYLSRYEQKWNGPL